MGHWQYLARRVIVDVMDFALLWWRFDRKITLSRGLVGIRMVRVGYMAMLRLDGITSTMRKGLAMITIIRMFGHLSGAWAQRGRMTRKRICLGLLWWVIALSSIFGIPIIILVIMNILSTRTYTMTNIDIQVSSLALRLGLNRSLTRHVTVSILRLRFLLIAFSALGGKGSIP
jgi:hypothetical protein